MAEYHHTPEPASAKAKYPTTRQLTILETACPPTGKTRGIGFNYVPVNLEPCIVLRGKWLRKAGFFIGEKVRISVNERELVITLNQVSPGL